VLFLLFLIVDAQIMRSMSYIYYFITYLKSRICFSPKLNSSRGAEEVLISRSETFDGFNFGNR